MHRKKQHIVCQQLSHENLTFKASRLIACIFIFFVGVSAATNSTFKTPIRCGIRAALECVVIFADEGG